MANGIVIKDEADRSLYIDDIVRVKVGSGRVMRPGVVTGLTTKNVKIRFEWANGRVTERRFPVCHTADRVFTPGVQWVRAGEVA